MATITKSFLENGSYGGTKATWTFSWSASNITLSEATHTWLLPTMTAKYVASNKGYGGVDMIARYLCNGTYLGNHTFERILSVVYEKEMDEQGVYIPMTSNTVYSVPLHSYFETTNYTTITTSDIFNSSNPTSTSEDIVFYTYNLSGTSSNANDTNYNNYTNFDLTEQGIIATATLNAPPQVTIGTPTYSIPYANIGSYVVPLTTLTAQFGGNITFVTLTVGGESTTQTYSSNTVSNQTISVTPSVIGQYTPILTVTDSRGQTTTRTLSSITVNQYDKPSVNFDVYRTDNDGKKADEGHYALIQSTISYTDGVATPTEPSIQIDGIDLLSLTDVSVTWYKTWSDINGVSNVISDWTTLVPQNHMVTIYGLIDWDYDTTGNFAEDTSYQITLIANDSVNGHSTPIIQTLSTAFYTIDFQAGGKEIAFGSPANDNLTNINGKDYSDEGLFKCKMGTSFNDMTTGAGGEVEEFISELDINGAGIELTQSDWIIEQGTDGMWIWRKWQSGLAECWGQYSYTSSTSTAWSAPLYYSDSVSAQPYPFTFKSIPMEWASVDSSTNALWLYKESSGHNTVSSTAVYRPIKVSAFSSNTFDIRYYVVGRWK